jgi:hypothetical protein
MKLDYLQTLGVALNIAGAVFERHDGCFEVEHLRVRPVADGVQIEHLSGEVIATTGNLEAFSILLGSLLVKDT